VLVQILFRRRGEQERRLTQVVTLLDGQPPQSQEIRQVSEPPQPRIRRRHVEHRHQRAGDPLELRLVPGERTRIAG
jgi:hypothetical protein